MSSVMDDPEIRQMWAKYLGQDWVQEGLRKRMQSHARKEIERDAKRYVYFILSAGLLKVGFSQYPEDRLEQIRTANAQAVLIGYVKGGRMKEKEMHKRLAEWNWGDEWFYYVPEVHKIVADYLK